VKGISSEKGSIVGGLKAGSMIGSLSIITGVPEGFLQEILILNSLKNRLV